MKKEMKKKMKKEDMMPSKKKDGMSHVSDKRIKEYSKKKKK